MRIDVSFGYFKVLREGRNILSFFPFLIDVFFLSRRYLLSIPSRLGPYQVISIETATRHYFSSQQVTRPGGNLLTTRTFTLPHYIVDIFKRGSSTLSITVNLVKDQSFRCLMGLTTLFPLLGEISGVSSYYSIIMTVFLTTH